jgi:Putative MetA-pathway of phenol degradation
MVTRCASFGAALTVTCLIAAGSPLLAQTPSSEPPPHFSERTGAAAPSSPASDIPDLVTDRPDFTESSQVVGAGVLQLESGVTFERDRDAAVRNGMLSTPQLLRVGVSPRLEFRLASDALLSESVSVATQHQQTTGGADTEIGLKYTLTEAPLNGFDFALIAAVSLPTGADGLSSGGYDPGIKFTWARDLPRGFGLSGNVNVASITVDESREWERSLSVSLGHPLGEQWGAYWETYGFVSGEGCSCTFNTGVTRALGRHMQVDVAVGRGLTSSAPDWFAGVGFSIRRMHR